MSVEKKPNGKWQVRYRDHEGRQKAKTFDRKLDADRHETAMKASLHEGRYVDPKAGRATLGSYLDDWLAGQPWRQSTRSSRLSIVDTRIRPTFGSMPLSAVRASDVQNWVGRMASDGLAPSTVGAYFRVLAQVMRSAVRDRLIAESPCDRVRLPTNGRGSSAIRVPTPEEVELLAGAVPGKYRALVLVSAALGLRQGEACAISTDRVNFLHSKITIDRQIVSAAHSSQHSFGPVKTPSSHRTIPLPASVARILLDHIASHVSSNESTGGGHLLFTTATGGMLGRQAWQSVFSRAAKGLGLPFTSHDLRHYAASRLIADGCSARAVAHFLGHKNPSETLNTYAHLWPTDEERISSAIERFMTPALGLDVHEMCTDHAERTRDVRELPARGSVGAAG